MSNRAKLVYLIKDKLSGDFPVFAVDDSRQAQRIFRNTLANVHPDSHDDFELIFLAEVDIENMQVRFSSRFTIVEMEEV